MRNKIFLLVIVFFVFVGNLYAQTELPNVIVILADDQGWGATSVIMDQQVEQSASDFIHTPNLERLAESGIVFSRAYAPHPNCSPTRASILTGKSPAQLRFTDIIGRNTGSLYEYNYLIPPMHINQLPEEEITIAEWIKQHRPKYKTAHFGKWHVGYEGPRAHGFDAGDGPTTHPDGNENVRDDPKNIFSVTRRATGWLETQHSNDHPFFLQISHYAVHRAIKYQPSTMKDVANWPLGRRHRHQEFAAMTKDLDTGIGMILDKLEELGIKDNTYVIYTSDNGTYPTRNPYNLNGPLHGWKATLWEGGIRVPFILSGPEIGTGQIDHPVIGYDIFPTISEWLGIDGLPSGVEGGSLARLVKSEGFDPVQRPRDYFAFHFPHYQLQKGNHPVSALVRGRYKLIKFYETGNLHLYDLDQDLCETRNLIYQKPHLAKKLHQELIRYLSEVDAALPAENFNYDPQEDPGKFHRATKEQLMKVPYFVID